MSESSRLKDTTHRSIVAVKLALIDRSWGEDEPPFVEDDSMDFPLRPPYVEPYPLVRHDAPLDPQAVTQDRPLSGYAHCLPPRERVHGKSTSSAADFINLPADESGSSNARRSFATAVWNAFFA